jgi:hypothetical protein
VLAREKSHSLGGLLLPRHDEGVSPIAEPAAAALKPAAFGRSGELTTVFVASSAEVSLSLAEYRKRRSIR